MDYSNYFERFFDLLFYVKIFALARSVSLFFFVTRVRNWHPNTGL